MGEGGTARRLVAVPVAVAAWLLAFASSPAQSATRPPGFLLNWSRPLRVDHFAPSQGNEPVYDVQCPSTSLCVAVDDQGNLLASTDPSGGLGSWRITNPSSGIVGQRPLPVLQLLSCPTVTLCVAGAPNDRLLVSTNPAGGPAAWRSVKVQGATQILEVSCPSSTTCFAVDDRGELLSSTNPTGGAGAWTERPVFPPGYEAPTSLSCPSARFCAAVDETDRTVRLMTSTQPTRGPSAWQSVLVDHQTNCERRGCFIDAVSCPSAGLCVAFDGSNVFTSTAPTTGPWTTTSLAGSHRYGAGISCGSVGLCLAFDTDGAVFSSSDPTGGAGAWTETQLRAHGSSGLLGLSSVACPASTLCVASTFPGQILTTKAPGKAPWRIRFRDDFNAIQGVSCPGQHLCVAVDNGGNVLSSTDPTIERQDVWHATRIDPPAKNPYERGLVGISCPSGHMCAAWDARSRIFTSRDPTGAASGWKLVRHGPPLVNKLDRDAVDCPTPSLCLAVDYAGHLWFTPTPLKAGAAWRKFTIDRSNAPGGPGLESIGCFRARLCVAGDLSGHILVSTDPTRGPRAWKKVRLEGSQVGHSPCRGPCTPSLWTVSCQSAAFCLLDDGNGFLFSSTHPRANSADWNFVSGLSPNVSCSATTLCFSFGISESMYDLYISTNPAAGAWQPTYVDEQNQQTVIEGVSCAPSTTTCVGVDDHGDIFSSR